MAGGAALKVLGDHSSAARVTGWGKDQVIFSGLSSLRPISKRGP